jgi:hypothetical protein
VNTRRGAVDTPDRGLDIGLSWSVVVGGAHISTPFYRYLSFVNLS